MVPTLVDGEGDKLVLGNWTRDDTIKASYDNTEIPITNTGNEKWTSVQSLQMTKVIKWLDVMTHAYNPIAWEVA